MISNNIVLVTKIIGTEGEQQDYEDISRQWSVTGGEDDGKSIDSRLKTVELKIAEGFRLIYNILEL